jgi:[protein-PII] uridylyltransferase
MLMILTNADIRAVGPNIWNAWKRGLLDELYYRSLEDMEMTGGQPAERRAARVERAKQKLRARLYDWDEAVRELYIARGYSDYWLAYSAEEQESHFAMMREMERQGRELSLEVRQHPGQEVTEIIVYAPDHAGLFAQIAGAIALSGASIVDAKVVTLANSMALDAFRIQDLSGRLVDAPDRIQRLLQRIEAAVTGKLHPDRELQAQRQRALPSRTGVFKVPPRVIFDNKASIAHTVIEVNGRDRPGFLHDVTSTLTALGLQIVSAHISTYGERVVDVFYVKDVFGLKIEQPQKLVKLQERLLAAIEPPADPPACGTPEAAPQPAAAAE